LALGAPPRALILSRSAVAADPFDEAAWRAVMTAHTAAGEPAAALAAYEQLRQVLAEELGTDPPEQTQALHLAIPRADPGAQVSPAAPASAPADSGFVGREGEVGDLTGAWEA